MATSRSSRRHPEVDPAPSPEDIERALDALRERLRDAGAVKLSSIKPKGWRGVLVARLIADGHEQSATWLRRPLEQQLREALEHGAVLSKKALTSVVRGAAAAELARVSSELERAGDLHRVLRGKTEAFTGGGTRVLTPESLRALKLVVAQLHQGLGVASRKKGMTLLLSDVAEALGVAQAVLERDASAEPPRAPDPSLGGRAPAALEAGAGDGSLGTAHAVSLFDALDATRDERTGLSFVPRLVQLLLPDVSLAVAHEMLLAAARQELIELRPEGGLGRLTSDELALCPPGPGGTRLSWARRLGGAA